MAVRDGMYRSLADAFAKAGIQLDNCTIEDRGDGALILVPPEIPKSRFVEAVPQRLADALNLHNNTHPKEEQIRLRVALHAGEVYQDKHGVTAAAINLAMRLLEAPALRSALANSQGVLALITSGWFYDEVVRHSSGNPAEYYAASVEVKETSTEAWICVLDNHHSQARTNSDK